MSDEFCTGVKILLARMESNPEEFELGVTSGRQLPRWHPIVQGVIKAKLENKSNHDTLTPAEVDALYAGLISVRRKQFDESIMRELLVDEELSSSIAKAPKTKLRLDGTKAPSLEDIRALRLPNGGITINV